MRTPSSPSNCSPDPATTPAAQEAFAGSLEVLQPYLDSGALVVPSGRTDLEQAAILRGKPSTAASRVAGLLDDGVELAGVLSPSDAMSAAVAEVLADAGLDVATELGGWTAEPLPPRGDRPAASGRDHPAEHRCRAGRRGGRRVPMTMPADPDIRPVVLTGGGSTLDGVQAVVDGTQTATVYEDPRELARVVASMVREVVRGQRADRHAGRDDRQRRPRGADAAARHRSW